MTRQDLEAMGNEYLPNEIDLLWTIIICVMVGHLL